MRFLIKPLIFLVIFFGLGYFLSDDRFFKKVIIEEKILNPLDAFNYINSKTKDPDDSFESYLASKTELRPGHSPRHILTNRKYIWCDEGAVVLATFAKKLGYKTRLVDLINIETRISGHTVLEIYEGNKWTLYDTQNDLIDASYDMSAGYISEPRYRKYPKVYNFFIQNNFFIKKIIFWIRGIHE